MTEKRAARRLHKIGTVAAAAGRAAAAGVIALGISIVLIAVGGIGAFLAALLA